MTCGDSDFVTKYFVTGVAGCWPVIFCRSRPRSWELVLIVLIQIIQIVILTVLTVLTVLSKPVAKCDDCSWLLALSRSIELHRFYRNIK